MCWKCQIPGDPISDRASKNPVRARDLLLTLLSFAKNLKKYRRSNFRESKHESRENKRSGKNKLEYKSSKQGAFQVGGAKPWYMNLIIHQCMNEYLFDIFKLCTFLYYYFCVDSQTHAMVLHSTSSGMFYFWTHESIRNIWKSFIIIIIMIIIALTTLSLQVSTFGKWATHECCRFVGLKIVDLKSDAPTWDTPRERAREEWERVCTLISGLKIVDWWVPRNELFFTFFRREKCWSQLT